MVSTAVWLPGLLAVIELVVGRCTAVRASSARDHEAVGGGLGLVPLLLIGAGMVTLQFLAGHLEMSLYLLITAGLYTALRLAWMGVARGARGVVVPGRATNAAAGRGNCAAAD